MAERSSTALQELDEQLTCSVCLDQYTNPKTLPCLHTFCIQCIERLPQEKQGDKRFISCPSCRKPTQLPDQGARNFPTAFLVNSLFGLQDTLKRTSSDADQEGSMLCEFHHDPLKVYCESCQKLICRDCTLSQHHQNHKYKLVTECYPDHHQEIEANLKTVKNRVDDINTAVTSLITREKEVTEQGEEVKNKIRTQAQMIINLVQQSEQQLIQQVDAIVEQKMKLLASQREEAESILNQLKGCEDSVEQSLKVRTQQEVLKEKQNMLQVMKRVYQVVNPVTFQPIEDANITFSRNPTIDKIYDGIGELKSTTFGKSSLFKDDYYADIESTINFSFQSLDGSPFSIPPSLISYELSCDSQLIPCDMNENQPGNYAISFIPSTGGSHQLILQIGGVHISGSPFTLSVFPFPKKGSKPEKVIRGLNRPWGVAVTKDCDIVVAEKGADCITILNKKGEMLRSFGRKGKQEGQFTNPRGVALTDDQHVLVTDDHRLQKLTFEGRCVKSVGSSKTGNGPLQFNHPTGVVIHPTTGQIFVADRHNNRIQVLSADLTYFYCILEAFNYPYDVTFDNEGFLFVADSDHHCIKKLTLTGQCISKFGSSFGSNPGQFKQPLSVVIYNNLLYTTDNFNNRVSVFHSVNGRFIHCFGKKGSGDGEFLTPYGITVDSLGNLYVCDSWNNRLVVW